MTDLEDANCFVAWHVAMHFWTKGEWPTPEEVWERINEGGWLGVSPISLEEARQLCIQACDSPSTEPYGDVYGIPTVTAMRLGEAKGDWTEPLGAANPFRLAVGEATMREFGSSPQFARAVAYNMTKVA